MDQFLQSKQEFLAAFRQCTIYKNYVQAKAVVDEQPELHREINSLRAKNYFFQQQGGRDNYEGELELLAGEKERISANKAARDFLQAELDLCRLVQQIEMELMDQIDIETEFVSIR